MTDNQLLDSLIQIGKLDATTSSQVKLECTKTGKSVESIVLERGIISELELVKIKAQIFNIPFVNLENIVISESVWSLLPVETLRRYKMVILEAEGFMVKVAMADPFDIQALEYVKGALKNYKRFDVYIASKDQILEILDKRSGATITDQINESLNDVDEDSETTEISDTGALDPSQADLANAPVAKIVNTIIEFAAKSNASDIHIEPLEDRSRVRYRIHGILVEKISLPKSVHSAVVARIKIMARLKIDVKRAPQDGRIPMKFKDRSFDLRVSTLPAVYGEKVVLRLLERGGKIPTLEESGLRGPSYKAYIEAIKSTVGIVLITGPTGSGKTRTLASTIIQVNDEKVNIVTLEDPVEIRINGVNQVQVNPQAGLTFANGLRSILRQDPNIIMVGEIRDGETAQLAVQAALTGHLVFATLHTNSAAAALPRLVDMGVENYLLASTIKIVVAQRLVRTVCPNCIEAVPVSSEVIYEINNTLGNIEGFDVVSYLQAKSKQANLPKYFKPPVIENGSPTIYLYKGRGCDKCGGLGYVGRTGIFEVLSMNDSLGRLLMKNKPTGEIEAEGIRNGMITMRQDGFLKALDGITTIEEVLRVINT